MLSRPTRIRLPQLRGNAFANSDYPGIDGARQNSRHEPGNSGNVAYKFFHSVGRNEFHDDPEQ
jgi:hypothetical protein